MRVLILLVVIALSLGIFSTFAVFQLADHTNAAGVPIKTLLPQARSEDGTLTVYCYGGSVLYVAVERGGASVAVDPFAANCGR